MERYNKMKKRHKDTGASERKNNELNYIDQIWLSFKCHPKGKFNYFLEPVS